VALSWASANFAITANVYSHVMLDDGELDDANLLEHARS
jgi:hypothetical protein